MAISPDTILPENNIYSGCLRQPLFFFQFPRRMLSIFFSGSHGITDRAES